MDIEKVKEDLSICYLKTIALVKGIALEEISHDEDSTDVWLKKIVKTGCGGEFNSQIRVQLKTTSSPSQYSFQNDFVSYRLKVKNYNDLCVPSTSPAILGLLILPGNEEEWVNWTETEIMLRGRMFWYSLNGKSKTENKNTVSIKIPLTNKVDEFVLEQLLIKAAEDGYI